MSTTVAVLGAGTMGHGIAVVAATCGCEVRLRDVDEDRVEDGLEAARGVLDEGVERGSTRKRERETALENLHGTTDLAEAVDSADVVVEAVPEDLDLKREVLGGAENRAPRAALLASNTSSLSIEAIGEALDAPERFLGLHFFNPPYALDLVEVVHGPATSEDALERGTRFADDLGKEPIQVRDAPGFASSRLGVALGLEAIRMVEEGVASPEDIDTAMTTGYNHPMGPLELTDLVGLDVRLDIAEHLAEELGPRFDPPDLLREMIEEGKLGRKAGEGFYTYDA
jgi:3-hydroxybutyryl-CoA dehydrogenase